MDNQPWNENEITQAYDAKFQILEAARKEYEQAVLSLLEDIRTTLMAKWPQDSLAEGVALEVSIKDSGGFSQQILDCGLKVPNDSPRIRVLSRFAAPWGGTPGFLQLGVSATLDEKLIAPSPEALRGSAEEDGLWDQDPERPTTTTEIKGEPDWIHGEAIALTDAAFVDTTADGIRRLLTPASELASQIDDEYRFTQRVLEVLGRVRKGLEAPNADSDYKVSPKIGWWQGMRFVQIDSKGRPSYWVGYHVKRQCLMYGHPRLKTYKELVRKFASAVGCDRTEVHGSSPAGVLFDKNEIEKMADDERASVDAAPVVGEAAIGGGAGGAVRADGQRPRRGAGLGALQGPDQGGCTAGTGGVVRDHPRPGEEGEHQQRGGA